MTTTREAGARLIAACALILISQSSAAQEWRAELTGGICQYGRAGDGSWWKERYEADFNLRVPCASVAVSKAPWALGAQRFGFRLAWNDLGRPNATTTVPVLDDEANGFPNGAACDLLTGSGCVGRYRQEGGAYGLSLAALMERRFGGVTLGAEFGILYYRSWWYVLGEHPAPGTCESCGYQHRYSWDLARGNHTTTLVGVTAEYAGWFFHLRRYSAIYASNAETHPLYIGLIAGPLIQSSVGYQWKF